MNKLKQARAKAGLTQVEVAASAGISTRYYQNLEAGESAPTVAVALKIAKLLGATVEELFCGGGKTQQ